MTRLPFPAFSDRSTLATARRFFEANARLYPDDPNARGSLAEFREAIRE